MKWSLITFFLVIIYLTNAKVVQEKRGVLRRTARQALSTITTTLLPSLRDDILSKCQENGASLSTLKDTHESFPKLEECLSKIKNLTVPRQEYVDKTNECTKNVYEKIKNCLPNDAKFIPAMDLKLTTALINFFYDNEATMKSTEFLGCIQSLQNNKDYQQFYGNCLRNIIMTNKISPSFTRSEGEFCRNVNSIQGCVMDAVDYSCKNSELIGDLTRRYREVFQTTCKVVDTVTV